MGDSNMDLDIDTFSSLPINSFIALLYSFLPICYHLSLPLPITFVWHV